ncbi:MAG: hypothetical protein WAM66_07525 [Acidobacteriaceae bacterium]
MTKNLAVDAEASGGWNGVDPVFGAGLETQIGVVLQLEAQDVQTGSGRGRRKAQDVAVGHVIRCRNEIALERARVVEAKELASCKPGDGFSGVFSQVVARGEE